jgi:hypothetical protein
LAKIVAKLQELYQERTRPALPPAESSLDDKVTSSKISSSRKQELVAESNVNIIEIEAQPL